MATSVGPFQPSAVTHTCSGGGGFALVVLATRDAVSACSASRSLPHPKSSAATSPPTKIEQMNFINQTLVGNVPQGGQMHVTTLFHAHRITRPARARPFSAVAATPVG